MSQTNTGSCHCGKVVYEVPHALGDVRFCYCQTCRKLNGTAFSAVAMVPAEQFKIVQGEAELVTYESTRGKHRFYCKTCHSPTHVRLESKPEQVRIRLGGLNFEPQVNLVGHIWVKEKPDWYQIRDNLPQHAEF
jgi:hypothetical protein